MKRIAFTIPVAVEITKEDSWIKLDENEKHFFMARYHIQLNERLIEEPYRDGDSIGLYQSPKGMSATHIESENVTREQIDAQNSIQKHLLESTVLHDLSMELAANLGVGGSLKASANLKSKASSTLKDSFSLQKEIAQTNKESYSKSITITNNYPPEETEPVVSVPVYRKRAYDVVLAAIDSLHVKYETSLFGLRHKSKKYPPVDNDKPSKRANTKMIGKPVATIYYWELQEKSSKFMYQKDHKVEVKDPSELIITAPVDDTPKVATPNLKPTLYTIASAAFPTKWIWRRSEDKKWTHEELMQKEEEIAKKKSNGWFKRHG